MSKDRGQEQDGSTKTMDGNEEVTYNKMKTDIAGKAFGSHPVSAQACHPSSSCYFSAPLCFLIKSFTCPTQNVLLKSCTSPNTKILMWLR
jgi:hypothetical protein